MLIYNLIQCLIVLTFEINKVIIGERLMYYQCPSHSPEKINTSKLIFEGIINRFKHLTIMISQEPALFFQKVEVE